MPPEVAKRKPERIHVGLKEQLPGQTPCQRSTPACQYIKEVNAPTSAAATTMLETFFSILVIQGALLFVLEDFVGLLDGFELVQPARDITRSSMKLTWLR